MFTGKDIWMIKFCAIILYNSALHIRRLDIARSFFAFVNKDRYFDEMQISFLHSNNTKSLTLLLKKECIFSWFKLKARSVY